MPKIILLLLWCCHTIAYAQHADFSYKRKIENVIQDGWYNVVIPNTMFSSLQRSMNDIRIYSITYSDTLEIPYLLKIREDQVLEENIDLPVLNKSTKNGVLFFSFDTKRNAVNYLNLNFSQQNFNAYVTIEGSNDQDDWYELIDNQRILSIKTESVQYATTQVQFPNSNYQYLRISIKSDVPLNLVKASFKNRSIKPGVIKSFTPSWIIEKESKSKQSILEIKLNDVTPINKIELDASSDFDFYRSFTLEYASDSSKTSKGWIVFYKLLQEGYITSLNKNIFNFDLQITKKLRLTIDNQDNVPLDIRKITISSPEVALITRLKPGDVILFYGNQTIESPSYDLIHFQEKIPDTLSTVTLGKEELIGERTESTSPLFANKRWLWIVMILTIGVLGFFTLRMMKQNT